MIQRTIAALGSIACALAGGCGTPTVHPSAAPGTVVADPGLPGEWAADEPLQLRAMIRPAMSDGKSAAYTASLTVHDKGEFKTALGLELTLTEIETVRFVDLFPARPDRDRLVGMYGFLAVPVHQVMRIDRDGDTMTVRPLLADRPEDRADGAPVSRERIVVGGGEIAMITASTRRLRDLLAEHANDPAAFGDPIVFRRIGR